MWIARKLRAAAQIASRRAEDANARRTRAARRWRAHASSAAEHGATHLGRIAGNASRWLLLLPHRAEVIDEPPPLRVGDDVFDIVEDLCAFTRLPRKRVLELITRRHESFRSEWQALPEALRADHWYYLASRTYIFANAIHLHEDAVHAAALLALAPPGTHVLDFGGGTGNLSLALAASGHDVTYAEISAVQRDFVRFRISRHRPRGRVEIADWWDELPADTFDVVYALDVLEHLPALRSTLAERLLPAVRRGGALVESSPFTRSLSNPMHHVQSAALEEALGAAGFALEGVDGSARVWRRRG